MLTEAFRDSNEGIDIRYCTDGRLFNRVEKTKVKSDSILDLFFPDYCSLNSGSEAQMQLSTNATKR